MLYLIGIGLYDEKDITVKGLEAVKGCDLVYLENYTSKLQVSVEKLEEFYNKKINLADRDLIENNFDKIINEAKEKNVAVLVIGDIFGATTHIDIILRLKENKVKYRIIHNSSILNVVGETGLELYRFGKITSIPFENLNVEAPYDVLKRNKELHTLFLLDLDPKNNKFMNFKEAIDYLLKVEAKRKENIFSEDRLCVVCAALGGEKQIIKVGKVGDLINEKIEVYPQCLIVPGKLHFIEEEFLNSL
jgi:diphthine synthase